jgi:antitoxin (DNA-binding transcriptional repressor) of toxin-antitoxin stability system
MLFDIDAEEVPTRFAEMLATLDAGYGVIITKAGEPFARLVPESAFKPEIIEDPDDGLTPEERDAREMMAMFESMMNDSF